MGAAVGAGGASSPIMVVVVHWQMWWWVTGSVAVMGWYCGSGDELASGWALLFDFPHVM